MQVTFLNKLDQNVTSQRLGVLQRAEDALVSLAQFDLVEFVE